MSAGSFSRVSQFRETFIRTDMKQHLEAWFPGHMYKGMQQMQRKLSAVDCIIEVHDARIPFSGRNPNFYKLLTAIKPHILVLNKMDLLDMSYRRKIEHQFKQDNINNVLFTNCKANAGSGVGNILPLAIDLMKDSDFSRAFAPEFSIMIIGIPNVGKSSLINKLRNIHMKKPKANRVGALPGITKSVLENVKISVDPLVYLVDTPGIMQPRIKNVEVAMRLALCCTLNDEIVGADIIADYLLYWLNKHKNFSYVDYLRIPEPTDDVRILLLQVSKVLNKTKRIRNGEGFLVNVPDFMASARHFIRSFREGAFGKVLLDDDIINKV